MRPKTALYEMQGSVKSGCYTSRPDSYLCQGTTGWIREHHKGEAMQRFIAAAAAVLVVTVACGGESLGPEGLLVGTWREKSIDISGMRSAFVAYYIGQGTTSAAAAAVVDQFFAEFPDAAINGGSTITMEEGGRWTDSTGDAGTWAIEGENTLIIVSESAASARQEASFTVEGDVLTLSFNKAQYLNLIGDAPGFDREGFGAYEFFRAALPDTGPIVKVAYERMR